MIDFAALFGELPGHKPVLKRAMGKAKKPLPSLADRVRSAAARSASQHLQSERKRFPSGQRIPVAPLQRLCPRCRAERAPGGPETSSIWSAASCITLINISLASSLPESIGNLRRPGLHAARGGIGPIDIELVSEVSAVKPM